MKRVTLFLIIIVSFLNSCKSDDDVNDQSNNPNIPNAVFDTQNLIDLNLAQYNSLLIPSQPVVITGSNIGINGIVVVFTGSSYLAWELSDPNHPINNCSLLTMDGIIASCSCDDGNIYEVITGLPQEGTSGQYTLVPYRVEVNDTVIRVYNN